MRPSTLALATSTLLASLVMVPPIGTSTQGLDGGPSLSQQDLSPTLLVFPDTNQVDALGWPISSVVTLVIDRPATPQPADYTAVETVGASTDDPSQTLARFYLQGAFSLEPSDVITISGDGTTKTFAGINIQADRGYETVFGTAQPGSEVSVTAAANADPNHPARRREIADAAGTWLADFYHQGDDPATEEGLINIAHDVYITYVAVDPDGDAIHGDLALYSGPSITELPVEGLIASVRFSPGAAVSLTIDDPTNGPGVDYAATQVMSPGQTDVWFDLTGQFAFDAGDSISISDGTSSITETVGDVAIHNIDFDSHTISGSATPGSHIEIRDFTDGLMRHEVADHNGQWLTSFSVQGDFPGEQDTADITPATTGGISQRHARDGETGVEWLAPILIRADFSPSVVAVDQPATFTASFQGYAAPIEVIQYSLDAVTWLTLDRTDAPLSYAKGTGSTVLAFAEAGVYTIYLRAQDNLGLWSECSSSGTAFGYVVVYEPIGSFVTGGGWIDSPPGAYSANPSLTGTATFGFVSRYQRGASIPTGQTQFQFNEGDLNFHSSSFDWLVVAGGKAKFKGTGTINGSGEYGFSVSAIDGQVSGGGGVDRFRVKIWDEAGNLIYDNQLGAPDYADASTAIAGGSIMVHTAK